MRRAPAPEQPRYQADDLDRPRGPQALRGTDQSPPVNVLARRASASLSGNRRDTAAAAFFVLVTLVVTYPLPLHLSSRIATCCDAWLYYWHTWWTGQALLGLRLDQFFTDHIYYPTGTSLSFESLSNSVISTALSPVLGGVVAFNFLYLSSYVLGAFGTYLLVTRLTGDRKAGVVAGVVYAFSAVRTQNLQFTNMSAIQWMPFVALWSLKTIDSASVKSALAMAAFFVLAALSSGYYAVSASLMVLLILAWNARRVFSKPLLKPLLVFAGASLTAIGVLTYPVLVEALSSDSTLTNSQHARHFSADLVSFVLPSRFNPIYDSLVLGTYDRLLTHFTEWESYLGAVAIALAAVGVYKAGLRTTALWLTVLILFAALSLGPHPQVLGIELEGVPAPFSFLQDLPVLDAIRSPKRFLVTAMLALAVLSGYGSHHLLSLVRRPPRVLPYLVTLAIVALVLADYWGWPRTFVTSDAQVPRFFNDLAAQKGDVVLLHIPLPDISNPKPLYYQTVHGKRIIGGYVERPAAAATAFAASNKLLTGAVLPAIEDKRSVTPAEREDAETLFASLPEIKYVVLSKSHFFHPRLSSFAVYSRWLNDRFGPPEYEDHLIAVYRVETGP